jgi:hypothetical protein
MMLRCIERKNEILDRHVVEPLNHDADREVERILRSARANLNS